MTHKRRVRIFEQSKGKFEVRIIEGNRTRRIFALGPVSKSRAKKFAAKIRKQKLSF